MPTDPIGAGTYMGLAEPLFGDAVVEQENSSNYVRTYVHTSANTGGFLMGMDFRADKASSLLTDLALWDIDVDGGFRVLSGTSVLFELNSSGLYQGSTQLIDVNGVFLGGQKQQTVTINTTASTLVSSNSGKIHVLSTQAATSNFIYLPTSGNARVGDTWEIISNTTAASLWNLSILGANTGGLIYIHTGSTGAVNTTGAIDSTGSSGLLWWKVVCLTTTPEFVVTNMMIQSSLATTNAYGSVGTGTTA